MRKTELEWISSRWVGAPLSKGNKKKLNNPAQHNYSEWFFAKVIHQVVIFFRKLTWYGSRKNYRADQSRKNRLYR